MRIRDFSTVKIGADTPSLVVHYPGEGVGFRAYLRSFIR